jgi:hypothetical protein
VAFFFDATGAVALLTVPWFAIAVFALARCALDVVQRRAFTVLELGLLLPYGYLVVSATSSFLSRAGWTIFDISEPFVRLGGVHFIYAGFATMILGLAVAARVGKHTALVIVALGAVAPVVTGNGFTFHQDGLLVAGSVLVTALVWTIAGCTALRVVPHATGAARVLLLMSSASVLVTMLLAVFWALDLVADVPALSIPAMARIHGTLNAFAFVGCGLLGWRALRRVERNADARAGVTF